GSASNPPVAPVLPDTTGNPPIPEGPDETELSGKSPSGAADDRPSGPTGTVSSGNPIALSPGDPSAATGSDAGQEPENSGDKDLEARPPADTDPESGKTP